MNTKKSECWITSDPIEANDAATYHGGTIAHVFHSREEAETWLKDVEARKDPKHRQAGTQESSEEDSSDDGSAGSIADKALYRKRKKRDQRRKKREKEKNVKAKRAPKSEKQKLRKPQRPT
jgi:hypothetical protein